MTYCFWLLMETTEVEMKRKGLVFNFLNCIQVLLFTSFLSLSFTNPLSLLFCFDSFISIFSFKNSILDEPWIYRCSFWFPGCLLFKYLSFIFDRIRYEIIWIVRTLNFNTCYILLFLRSYNHNKSHKAGVIHLKKEMIFIIVVFIYKFSV